MDITIAKKYNVKFYDREFPNNSGVRIYKMVHTNNDSISEFLMDWDKVDCVERLLLPSIYDVLNGKEEEVDSGSAIINILLTRDFVEFSPRDDPDFLIPTKDFKELVEGWRDFLKQAPKLF